MKKYSWMVDLEDYLPLGLTVTEAMWKGTPVIGGRCGGIKHQITDGVNGFLVSSVEEAAQRIVELLRDPTLRERLGERGRETVRERFLLSREAEQYLDLFAAFEPQFGVNRAALAALGPLPSSAG
jgi:trehalose synthase